MGLIKALTSSTGSVLGDQFKEFVTCPTVDNNVLMVRGVVSHGEGNSNPTDGVITNGSKIAVRQGWAMMLVDNGAVKEFTSEPGEFIYDSGTEPTIFHGGLGQGIIDSIKTLGSRITYGGQAARDQRVYYVNLLNNLGNKFGSPKAEVVLDPTYGSVEITFHGEYSFKVVDPVCLVGNILGANAKDIVKVDDIIGQLKMQFTSNVSTCITNIMVDNNISFNVVQKYKQEVAKEMNDLLDESWKQQYGLEVQDVTLIIGASDETMERIREYSQTKSMGELYSQNTAGLMAAASAEALKNAAANENGAMMGFAGLNMASTAGAGMLNAVNQNVQAAPAPQAGAVAPAAGGAIPNFCPNCGTPTNGANFCGNCGNKLA